MRIIVGTPRRHACNHDDTTNDPTASPWPAYIQRATHIAERQLLASQRKITADGAVVQSTGNLSTLAVDGLLDAKPDLAPDGTTP